MAKAFFVEGPCVIRIVDGYAKINGGTYLKDEKVLIHANRSYIVTCGVEDCIKAECTQGKIREAGEEEVRITVEWEKTATEIASDCLEKKGCMTVVIGKTESGKTTFSETLSNIMISEGVHPCLIDGDIGQSTIGYPGFISSKIIVRRVLWERKPQPEHSFFVGSITPSGYEDKVILGFLNVINRCKDKSNHFVIDTDGWFGDRDSVNFKLKLIQTITPTHIVCLSKNPVECDSFIQIVRKVSPRSRFFALPAPILAKERNRTDRRLLRGEKVLLSDLRKVSVDVIAVPLLGEISLGIGLPLRPEEIGGGLPVEIVYAEKQFDKTLVIYRGKDVQTLIKDVQLIHEKRLENMVVGLVDEYGNHHFGIVEGFSRDFRSAYILTDFPGKVQYILTSGLKFKDGTIVGERGKC